MSAPVGISVTERTEGTRRVLEADGWEFVVGEEFGTDEPLIADEALAQHIGIEVESLRKLVRRHAGQTPDAVSGVCESPNVSPIPYSRTVRRFTKAGQNRGEITVNGFMLTEADALFIVTRSDAPRAVSLTKAMIQVFIAVRRHLLSTVAVVAHSRRPPTPRLPPAPAVVPEARQLPAPPPASFMMFRDLPDWPAIRSSVRAEVSADAVDAVGALFVPTLLSREDALTLVTPAYIRALAVVLRDHMSPAGLAREAAAARTSVRSHA